MEPPAEICENYQLKWSSYTSYIHSCIASSLVTEDSFADVALVTMDGHKIMAHRFVLSYASQYFNKALRFHPKVTTALPIMIVLPQSITYKALKILVKYMYSGEATVTKDILNVVLKAGDILKIKGLYREEQAEEQQNKMQKGARPATQVPNPESQAQKPKETKLVTEPVSKNPPPLIVSSSVNQKIIQAQSDLAKNKEAQKVQQNKLLQSKLQTRLQEKQPATSSSSSVKQYGGPRVLNFTMTNFNGTIEKENASPKRTIILNQKVAQQSDKPHTITSADAESQNSSDSTTVTIKAENGKTDNLSYLVIKDEPLEWTEADMEIVDEKEVFPEEAVKTESYDSTSNEENNADATSTEKDHIINVENKTNRAFSLDGLPPSVNLNISDQDFPEDVADLIDIPALIVKERINPISDQSDKVDKEQVESVLDSECTASDKECTAINKECPELDETCTAQDEEGCIVPDEDTTAHSDDDVVFVGESDATDIKSAPLSISEDENVQIIEPSTSYNVLETSTYSYENTSSACFDSGDSDSNSSSKPELRLSDLKEFDIISFINKDMIGRALLQRAPKGILGNTDRDRLADLVITHFSNKYGHLNMKQLKVLAKRFEQIPNEKSTTYFVDPVGKGRSAKGKSEPARGKLVDKCRNRLHLIRATLGLVKSKKHSADGALVDPNIARGTDLRDILNESSDNDTLMESPPFKKIKLEIKEEYPSPAKSVLDKPGYDWELKKFDLIGFIKQDLLGQALLKRAYHNVLNNSDRDRLADLLVTHFLNKYEGNMEINKLKTLAKLIEVYIPYEKSTTYFIGPVHKDRSKKGKSEPARGKLTDKYRNLKHFIKTLSGQVRKMKGLGVDIEEIEQDTMQGFPDHAIESQIWLKTNTEPESDVWKHWRESLVIRRSGDTDISTILEEWPTLKSTLALPLINADFENVCKVKEGFSLETEFNAIFSRVCNSRLFTLNAPDHSIFDLLSDDLSSGSNTEIYTPLTCELCTETFTIPGEWVKHVQTHTDMLPAKRRRRDSPDEEDENASYPELQCDLCDKSFTTPAEWVRHIQDTHTEFELSLSNRRNQTRKASVKKYKLVVKN